jgi:peroxiredoxin
VNHLVGRRLPDVELWATNSQKINPAKLAGHCVIFCYPYTGRPDHSDPPGWDAIPGAHGSTPQAIGFSSAYGEFKKQNVNVFGLSFQDQNWQKEFVTRNSLQIDLLSDQLREFSNDLNLPTFKAGPSEYLARLTLIAHEGVIVHARYPVPSPAEDAKETLAILKGMEPRP